MSRRHRLTAAGVPAPVVFVVVVAVAQVRFEDDVTDDPVAAEEFVDEEDYFQFIMGFRTQVMVELFALSLTAWFCIC